MASLLLQVDAVSKSVLLQENKTGIGRSIKEKEKKKKNESNGDVSKNSFLKHCQISKGVTKKIMFTKVI